jgi:hypothetical protein
MRSNPEIKNAKDAMNKDTTSKVDGAVSLALPVVIPKNKTYNSH